MDNLWDSLRKEIASKDHINFILKEKVSYLEQKLEILKGRDEMYKKIFNGANNKNQQLETKLTKIAETQDQIMNLAQKQRERSQMNHAAKDKLIQTLFAKLDEE
eukprot:12674702-Ditylum_brightwellii.AAC.1